ncbi:outer membrane lipoprotein carrier protein LolA [Candidatus Pelagibacter sp.]|nr:outer membrane lipoprotein carrier protein LolA [Candidatus Pelagibacter sp.]
MKKISFIFFIFFFNTIAFCSTKENIIKNLISIKNFSFNFEQNINGKTESGICTIEYPKKIFCKYSLSNKKILVSNGKSLVIKTNNGSYYTYPITRTPLNYILDKKFLINEIKNLNERIVDNRFINFTIFKDENEINIFFDKDNYNLVGWQTLDTYQNLSITYLSSIKKNEVLKKNIFKIPLLH